MKKLVLVAFIVFFSAGAVFGQAQTAYTVESITGSVQKESGNSRVNLRVGETLAADTVIHTAAGAALVLRFGERTITIPASKSGRVSELSASGTGLRISGNINRLDTSSASRIGGQISTASARASTATLNIEPEAEEVEEVNE